MTGRSIQHKNMFIPSYSRPVPRFGLVVFGMSPPRPGFSAWRVHVGFVVEKLALLLVSLRGALFRFFPVSIILQVLGTLLSSICY